MLNRVSCSFPLVGVGRCDPGGWWGGVDLFWEGHDITPEGIPQYLNLRPGIVQPDVKLETGEGAGGASLAPAGACEIERVLAEWAL